MSLRDHWLDRPIFALFAEVAARDGDTPALDDGTICLSYSEVLERVTAVGARIAAETPPGGLVALLLPQAAAQPIAVMAALAAGRVCLPLDVNAPPAHNADILAASGACALIVSGHGPLPDGCRLCIELNPDGTPVDSPAQGWQPQAEQPEAPALVIFTSGSTGVPKGIVLNQQAMVHQALRDIESCGLVAGDRYVALLSPATISPLRRLCAAWLTGGTLHVVDVHKAGLGGVLARLRDKEITVAAIFPSLLRTMAPLPAARAAFRSLRILRVGGEALDWAGVAVLRAALPDSCTILFAYGSTEVNPVLEHPIGAGPHPTAGPVPSGWLVKDCDLTLVDADGQLVPPGEIGEAVLRSRYMAIGHWDHAGCVPGPFRADPSAPEWRIFHTGDLLRRLPDGSHTFVGRTDRQVKIRGNRVEPLATESFLRRQPGVGDAAVIAYGPADAVILLAFIVPADTMSAPEVPDVLLRDLRATMSENLPPHQRPTRLLPITRIPCLPSFKPDLGMLHRLAAEALRPAERSLT